MNNLRFPLLSLFMILSSGSIAVAETASTEVQEQQKQELQQRIVQMVETVMAEVPDLSEEQLRLSIEECSSMFLEQTVARAEMMKIREQNLGRSKMREVREKMMDAQKTHLERISEILTEEQFEVFEENLEAMMPKDRRGRGKGMSGGGRGESSRG